MTADIYSYYPPIKLDKAKDKDRGFFFVSRVPHDSKVEIGSVNYYALEEFQGKYQLGYAGFVELRSFAAWIIPVAKEPLVPATKPVQLSHSHDCLVPLTTPGGTIRQVRVYPVKCIGGPADGSVGLLTAEPSKLFAGGCSLAWIVDLCHYPPPDPHLLGLGREREPDKSGFMIGSVSVYTLEQEKDRSFGLYYSGSALPQEYVKKHRPPEEKQKAVDSKESKP